MIYFGRAHHNNGGWWCLVGEYGKKYWPSMSYSSLFSWLFFALLSSFCSNSSIRLPFLVVINISSKWHSKGTRVSGCVKMCANSNSRYAAIMTKRYIRSRLLFSTAAFLFPAPMSAIVFQSSLLYGVFKTICIGLTFFDEFLMESPPILWNFE